MAPQNSPFQNSVPAAAPAPLTESALRQLQQAQAEEARKQSLQQSQRFQRTSPTKYSPPVQSLIPPGSPATTTSSAGGAGNSGDVCGYNTANSLSQASPFAFDAQQHQYQDQLSSRDVSTSSQISQTGEDYWGFASPRSGHSRTANAAAAVGAAGVASYGVNGGAGGGAGSPTPPPPLQFQPAATPAAVAAFQQWQHTQQAPQHVFNFPFPIVPEYNHVAASNMWPGLLARGQVLGGNSYIFPNDGFADYVLFFFTLLQVHSSLSKSMH